MQNLILLHGALGAKEQLNSLGDILSNDFKVHLLSFSGHGGNPFKSEFSISQFSNELEDYIIDNEIQKPNIFGYSMGGYVALYLAKHKPKLLGKIVTLATKFHWTPDIAEKEIKMLDSNTIEEKVPKYAEILKQRHSPNDWKVLLGKTAEMMQGLGRDNALKLTDYNSIENKVLIMIGDKDQMVTLEETIDVYRNLKDSNLMVLPNTIHPIEKVNLNKLSSELIDFIK